MELTAQVYKTAQIRDIESLASQRLGVSGREMMQRAGKAALDYLIQRWPTAKSIAVICGVGNNGGDGYTLAYIAHEQGYKVCVWQVGDAQALKNDALYAFENCKKAGIPMNPFLSQDDLAQAEVIVDAICGIGLKGEVRPDAKMVIDAINRSRLPVLALDIPSGIDANTGYVLGAAVRATATITFIGLKLGLLTGSGVAYTGELYCDPLQLPSELYANVESSVDRISFAKLKKLKKRPRDWHKGNAGHVLVVGGAPGYSGAPRLAAEAALRVGAGLVTIVTHPQHASFLNLTRPEIMCEGLRSVTALRKLIEKANVIVVGPGLGQDLWAGRLFKTVLESARPLIVDADALNMLAKKPVARDNWILTPHPGEAARLLKQSVQQVQKNRLLALQLLQQSFDGICVLKGSGTVIGTPEERPALCEAGNPGMATAGMGDVLSGVIGGLIAQGLSLNDAAKIGVCLHATAGDMAAKKGERGMIASDLMPYLRKLVNE